MDFLTLQTRETKIYFAMLDISFEHVESLHFIYGDFEYVDEEYDMEDETPDAQGVISIHKSKGFKPIELVNCVDAVVSELMLSNGSTY